MTIDGMESGVLEAVQVGSRIRAEDGHFGTVLYIGPVQGTKGDWYGVEWDNSERGKHDGEHQGVRYFTARAGAASFIRDKKVQAGSAFVRALSDRYGLQGEPNAGVSAEQLYVGDGWGQITKVEMVGAERVNRLQSQFQNLEIVVLQDCLIRYVEPDLDLAKLTPNIKELNLSRNLLTSWRHVADICRQLPRLKILNVSENRLIGPECADKLSASFPGLKTLFLNRMDIDFDTVLEWSRMWPCLEELHICFNDIKKLTNPGENFLRNVKLLNLEGNCLGSWDEVMKLEDMARLDCLVLNNCGIDRVELVKCAGNAFGNLRDLSLCGNRIGDWTSINELSRLQLQTLKLNGNPSIAGDKWENIRDIIVAKLATLRKLNRSEVSAGERRGAELCYLKRYGPEWLLAGGNGDPSKNNPSAEFVQNHPRFQALVDKYGAPEESEMHRAPQGLKDSLVSVQLRGPSKTVQKKVPSSMSVRKLKTLVQRLMKADLTTMVLTIVGQGEGEGHRVEMENDLRDLSFYSLENDDVIEVNW